MKAIYLMPLIGLLIPQAFALESNEGYVLEDKESISLILKTDSENKVHFEEVFITLENGEQFVMNHLGSKVVRISSDHSQGTIFGQSEDGTHALIRYQIDCNDVSLKAKIWTDSGTEVIITQGNIIPLF